MPQQEQERSSWVSFPSRYREHSVPNEWAHLRLGFRWCIRDAVLSAEEELQKAFKARFNDSRLWIVDQLQHAVTPGVDEALSKRTRCRTGESRNLLCSCESYREVRICTSLLHSSQDAICSSCPFASLRQHLQRYEREREGTLSHGCFFVPQSTDE
jgi:hypothetical protein